MGIRDWIGRFFNEDGSVNLTSVSGSDIAAEVFYKELAVQACVNLIANAVSRSEFVTYVNGNPVRLDNYYLFNVQPNINKSASKFWRQVIHKLVYENECLVVMLQNQLFVADSFEPKEYALKGNTYTNVKIKDYILRDTFREEDVFHFELHDQKIKELLDSLYNSYGQLIAYSTKNYKRANAKHGALEIPATYPQDDKSQAKLQTLLNDRIKKFFDADTGAVLPLTNGIKYQDLSSSGYKSGSDSRDIKALITDIFEFTAIGFQIPPTLLLGNVADSDKSVNNFLTFCINPIAETINDEVNRKYYSKKEFLDRTYMRIDTSSIKMVDLKEIANALDILFRIGANTINDNLKILGKEPINDPIGDQRFITKNYMTTEQALALELEGGEPVGKK